VKTSKAIETGSRDKSICSFSSCTTNSAYPIVRNQKATGSSSVGDGHDRHGHDSRVSARLAARCLAIKGRRSTCRCRDRLIDAYCGVRGNTRSVTRRKGRV
jgi:hypothetical protein